MNLKIGQQFIHFAFDLLPEGLLAIGFYDSSIGFAGKDGKNVVYEMGQFFFEFFIHFLLAIFQVDGPLQMTKLHRIHEIHDEWIHLTKKTPGYSQQIFCFQEDSLG